MICALFIYTSRCSFILSDSGGSANFSFEREEMSSVLGSRRSLAGTSVTSTADLSVFSNATTAGGTASRASQDNCSVTSEHVVASKTHRRLPSADSVTHFGSGRSTPKASLSGDHLFPSAIGNKICEILNLIIFTPSSFAFV